MAEALSVAASGIAVAQVAAQVGKSIIKLKQLWDELQDVPSTIGDLLDQIECLDPALWEAEHTFDQASLPPMFWDSSLASRSTAYCRKASSSLTELVNELKSQINRPGKLRSKIASAKVVLKKEQLRALERRLQNAVRMLTLAQQSYLVALTRVQPDIIIQRFTEITTPLVAQALQRDFQSRQLESSDTYHHQPPRQATKPAVDDDVENNVLTLRQPPRRRDSRRSFRFRLLWLSQTTWELQSSRSYGNWTLNLRCYSTVPTNSEVFDIAGNGTPRELQMLCARGLASPYDRRYRNDETLLDVALMGFNRPMVEHLLDIGVELSAGGDYYAFTIPYTSAMNSEEVVESFFSGLSSTGKLEAFFGCLDTCVDPERETCTCMVSLGSKVLSRFFRHFECPSHETTTLKSRLRQLEVYGFLVIDPMVIPDYLQPYWSRDIRAVCTTSTGSKNLLHLVANKLGLIDEELIGGWALLAGSVIGNTPNIHLLMYTPLEEVALRTPLMVLIRTLFACWGRHGGEIRIYSRLRLWLSEIRSNGYDLEEYGRREMELLADDNLKFDRYIAVGDIHQATGQWSCRDARLRGYEYGSEPRDWKILLSFRENSYAADFWRLIDEGRRVMPGAWVEEIE